MSSPLCNKKVSHNKAKQGTTAFQVSWHYFSSPLPAISSNMSAPPTNSPLRYTCARPHMSAIPAWHAGQASMHRAELTSTRSWIPRGPGQ